LHGGYNPIKVVRCYALTAMKRRSTILLPFLIFKYSHYYL
jgi:hypothetical protein